MQKNNWCENFEDKLFYHVSTDEVYGSLPETGLFLETTPYDPQSPYSSSKSWFRSFCKSLTEILMDYLLSSLIVLIIMDQINFLKNFYLYL